MAIIELTIKDGDGGYARVMVPTACIRLIDVRVGRVVVHLVPGKDGDIDRLEPEESYDIIRSIMGRACGVHGLSLTA